jgi:hypothetical protein
MISNADDGNTGSFPVEEKPIKNSSQFKKTDQDQLKMQKEEDTYDAFGENNYNKNIDPDAYQTNKDLKPNPSMKK